MGSSYGGIVDVMTSTTSFLAAHLSHALVLLVMTVVGVIPRGMKDDDNPRCSTPVHPAAHPHFPLFMISLRGWYPM